MWALGVALCWPAIRAEAQPPASPPAEATAATPIITSTWRELVRQAAAELRAESPDARQIEEHLRAARAAALARGLAEAREAEPWIVHHEAMLARLQGRPSDARLAFSSVWSEDSPELVAQARAQVGAMTLDTAVELHERAAQAISDELLRLRGQLPPETFTDMPALPSPLYQGPSRGRMAPRPPSGAAAMAPSIPDAQPESTEPSVMLDAAIARYQDALIELRDAMRAPAPPDDAHWNSELAMHGRARARELRDAYRAYIEELNRRITPPEQPQPDQQQQDEQQTEDSGDEQKQPQQQDGDPGQTPQDQRTPTEQRERRDDRETQEQQGQQPAPPDDAEQQEREGTPEGEEGSQSDEQAEQRNDEGQQGEEQQDPNASAGDTGQQQPPTPSDAQATPTNEGEQPEETPQGEEATRQQQAMEEIDRGPERGQREEAEPAEVQEAEAAELGAQPQRLEETPGQPTGSGAAAAPVEARPFGLTRDDARILLESMDDTRSEEGRRNFIRLLRRQPQQAPEREW